jgi:hypothetical protein
LPVGHGRRFNVSSKAFDYVVGGWSANMINTMNSGLPIDVGYSASSQQQVSDLVSERPNLVPGQPLYLSTGNPVYEARFVQFRAEAFNLLNKTNFATVSGTNSNSSGFGVFNATFPARQLQLAFKLVF